MGDLGVELGQAVLVLRKVVERAIVSLSVPMLRAEDVRAFAGDLYDADLFRALPALVRICLSEKDKNSIKRDCSTERKKKNN